MTRLAQDKLWMGVLIAMAVGLHIQPTISLGDGEVRFSLSDPLGLVFAPAAGWLLIRNIDVWKRREARVAIALIATISLVMTIGLVRAGMSSGGVSGWAWVKYLGWYVLLYYGLLGVLAGALAPEIAIRWFVGVLVAGHVALIAAYIFTQWAGISWPGSANPRMSGLVDNPNAYGLSLLCALALWVGAGEALISRLPKYSFEFVCGLLIAGVLYTRSLGALGGLFVLIGVAYVGQRDFIRILRVFCIALAIYALPWAGNSLARLTGFDVVAPADSIGAKLSDPDKYAFSLSARIESNGRAFALWREAPVFGTGLGVFYDNEKTRLTGNAEALQIHNTPLWFLAEFGLVGLFVFGALFACVAFYLFRSWLRLRGADPPGAGLVLAGLMILGGWATMSLAHELMYQRVPWFTLSLCAGICLVASVPRTTSST